MVTPAALVAPRLIFWARSLGPRPFIRHGHLSIGVELQGKPSSYLINARTTRYPKPRRWMSISKHHRLALAIDKISTIPV